MEEQVQHIPDEEVHDHLGEGVVEKVAENVPDFFQPAEQKFDVPLSQQFSAASSSMGEEVDQITTTSPLVVDMEEVEDVYTPAFQTTTTPTTDNSQNEASETLNEAPTEEPSAGGLFGSLTNMFGSSTESPTQTSQEEGQTKLLYFYASSPWFWDNSVFSFQGRPKYLFLFLFGYLLHASLLSLNIYNYTFNLTHINIQELRQIQVLRIQALWIQALRIQALSKIRKMMFQATTKLKLRLKPPSPLAMS